MPEVATLIVTATPNSENMDAFQAYVEGAMPLLIEAGGKLVKRQKITNVINGKPSGTCMVMDFDSADTIKNLFASDRYKALVPTRDKGFSEINILVASDM